MTAVLRLVPLEKTPRGRAKLSHRKAKNPKGTLTGSRISDLAVLGKAIVLTPDEARRFNARAHGYSSNPKIPVCSGYSDASGEFTSEGILFLHQGGSYIR